MKSDFGLARLNRAGLSCFPELLLRVILVSNWSKYYGKTHWRGHTTRPRVETERCPVQGRRNLDERYSQHESTPGWRAAHVTRHAPVSVHGPQGENTQVGREKGDLQMIEDWDDLDASERDVADELRRYDELSRWLSGE